MSQEDVASNRSALREFLASIATISGDLSNITAPPFVLLENSTVELPQYQADHTELFLAPATEDDPAQRALLVLKNFLSSLRNQQYAGRSEDAGVKKPLNAFLGELFLGSWQDEELGETRLLTEQVSHHPPITACYIWNEKLGISAQGFTQQEITFSGNVHIKQKGYALLHLDKYDEDFLIPVPNVKVKGILTGPYPELHGEYNLISSSGYVSHIKFEGKGFFGSGTKNGFHARMFHVDSPKDDIYTIEGAWNGVFKITSSRAGGERTETFDVTTMQARKLQVAPLDEQDAWESQRAWQHTIAALRRGDMRRTTDSKSKIEQGQRQMRRDEEAAGQHWQPLFYTRVEHDPVFDKLAVHDTGTFTVEARTGGIWKINRDAVNNVQRPFHGELTPANRPVGEAASAESSRRGSGVSHRSGSNASSAANSLHAAAVNGRARANGNANGNASPRTSMSGASSSRSSSEARRKSSSSEAARRSFSSVSSRRSGEIPTEEMRAMGISEGTPEHAKTNGVMKHKSHPSSGYFEQMRQAAWSVTAAAGSLIGVGGGGAAAATKTVDDERDEVREVVQPVREPTDGEVEMYLRVKHSNLH